MRIAVLELLALPERRPGQLLYHMILTKQFASVMPQAVSVWCRQLGHEVTYATYYGVGDPLRRIPGDAELVFISCYTQVSPLAYAIAKILRGRGAITIVGGPHAKAFPIDAARFFDYVVGDCDRDLVKRLLAHDYEPGSIVSSAPPRELPLVEERLPELLKSTHFSGRVRGPTTTIPLLASMGCPYACNFCIDWKSAYQTMPSERLVEDVRFIGRRFPGALAAFHDPNFGVRFDETLSALESQPPHMRPPYVMESSLSVLKPARMERLATTNCVFVAPGVESWDDYSNKSNGASKKGTQKVESVVRQFHQLHEHVPSLQANFIFGLDSDRGEAPIELMKKFMNDAPFVWPVVNIPVPFGGTPLFDEMRKNEQILEQMPFRFYYAPYSVTRISNYDPVGYYRRLIDLFSHRSLPQLHARRMALARSKRQKLVNLARAYSTGTQLRRYRRILSALESDPDMRAYHEGRHRRLPDFYRAEYARGLGRYAELLDDRDRHPVLDQQEAPTEKAAVPPRRRSGVGGERAVNTASL
jgi:radical SAM superfamily enzyme YgiQ (UPF0313 family)